MVSEAAYKRLRDLGKTETRILNDIRGHVMVSRMHGDPTRDKRHIHPSDLAKADFCRREIYFRVSGEPITDPQRNPSFQMETIFEEGHEIHRKWQTWLWEMGVLYGLWFCLACETEWWDVSPKDCIKCKVGRDLLVYMELPIEVPSFHLIGHADGAIHDGKGNALLELKSVGIGTLRFEAPQLYEKYVAGASLDSIWKAIRRPFASHIIQGQLYLWALEDYDEIVFIYEFKPNQSVKELRMRKNPDVIASLLEDCRAITGGLRSGFPPWRPDWAQTPDGPKCKSCVYRSACWGLEQEDDGEEASEPRTRVAVRKSASARRRARRRTDASNPS